MSHDFNEAIQNPALVFYDADLKLGETVVGPQGLPLPRSGNFADVYQMRGADGRNWAVKCFTRPVAGLGDRYARIDEALGRLNLPFVVGFAYLNSGIRVNGEMRPVVKMEWVEGLLLNQVVRDKLNQPATLAKLGLMWVNLCKRLRESGIAHTDIQHGNVLLVPGSRAGAYGLKLIDYDGMYVPALANTPSGEAGHPAYQHPGRASGRIYSVDLDRFPHLVIATALKGLETGGADLWERFDSGDNLLFTENDFRAPNSSKLMRELWQIELPAIQSLVGHLALSCGKAIPQTPWLDQLAPDGDPIPLDNALRKEAARALGLGQPVPVSSASDHSQVVPTPLSPDSVLPGPALTVSPSAPRVPVHTDFTKLDEEAVPVKSEKSRKKSRRQKVKKAKSNWVLLIVGAVVLLAGGVVVAGVLLFGGKQQAKNVAQSDEQKGPEIKDPQANSTGLGTESAPKKPKDKDPLPIQELPKETVKKEDEPPVVNPPPQPPPPNAGKRLLTVKERLCIVTKGFSPLLVAFDPDGESVITNSSGGTVGAMDIQKPAYRKLLSLPSMEILPEVIPLHGGRVAAWNRGQNKITVTDIQTGRNLTPLPFPNLPLPATRDIGAVIGISADERYIAAGRKSMFGQAAGDNEKSYLPAPFRLLDTKTGKTVLAFEWRSGSIHFNADSSRVLVVDAYLRGRWFKLPSGQPDGDWKFSDATVGPHPLEVQHSASDGRLLLCHGNYEGQSNVMMLMDGETGRVTRILGPADRGFGTISADCGTVFMLESKKAQKDFVVYDTNRGVEVSRGPMKDPVSRFTLAISPNGRMGAAVQRDSDTVAVRFYDLQSPAESVR